MPVRHGYVQTDSESLQSSMPVVCNLSKVVSCLMGYNTGVQPRKKDSSCCDHRYLDQHKLAVVVSTPHAADQ